MAAVSGFDGSLREDTKLQVGLREHSIECLYPGKGQDNGNGGKKPVLGEWQPWGQAEKEALEGEELDRLGRVRRAFWVKERA